MKKANLVAILVAAAGIISFRQVQTQAQDGTEAPSTGRQQDPQRETTRQEQPGYLSQELNLTEQQRTNVLAVFEQMRQKMEAAGQELRSNADAQLRRILTPEQYRKLQALSEAHERQWGNGGSDTNEFSNPRR